MDTVDEITRSYIMSRVGQKNTGPETLLRSALHAAGFRYRLHDEALPGRPDLVLPRFHAVVFVHGCYWHAHGCYRSTIPKTRRKFWTSKFAANKVRDKRNTALLIGQGWRVLAVWECALIGKRALPPNRIAGVVGKWLNGADLKGDIRGVTSHKRTRN